LAAIAEVAFGILSIRAGKGGSSMSKSNGAAGDAPTTLPAIASLSVAGFKSIVQEQTLEIRPLTLLAGANSSGKSSMMQPLLLLKQTLETPYDPGPLLLNGPNVKFTSVSQFWPTPPSKKVAEEFVVSLEVVSGVKFAVAFRRDRKNKGLALESSTYYFDKGSFKLSRTTEPKEAVDFIGRNASSLLHSFNLSQKAVHFIKSTRFAVELAASRGEEDRPSPTNAFSTPTALSVQHARFQPVVHSISDVVHLPGLRGNPERIYPVASIGPRFPGTFESYMASLIASWTSGSSNKVGELSEDLKFLGLTWKIEANRVNDTQVELRVGRVPRLKQGGAHDLVSIADVGFGVSQTLPVVVALRAAKPGQLVYLEQPEIHLHPRAQVAMARLLVNAANRGVRVVAETHSSLILLAVQTLVAEGVIEPGLVGLNWFLRDEKEGTTRIKTAELDEAGRFGDWPEDFDEVALEAENRYLSAAEDRLAKG
jgi:hypothetical protein